MKNTNIILLILLLSVGCSKENNNNVNVTHSMLIGKWLFEKESISTNYLDSVQKDTTIFFDHDTLEFDSSQYCKRGNLRFYWYLKSDTICISSCPENMVCDYMIYHYYKIIEFDKTKEMIWKEEYKLEKNILYEENKLYSSSSVENKFLGTEIILEYYRKIN